MLILSDRDLGGYVMTIKIIVLVAIMVMTSTIITFLRKRLKSRLTLHGRYVLQLFRLIVILVCAVHIIEMIDPSLDIKSITLAGSALVVAIVGFAAQPAILDIICGLLISIYKPFEIGDRVIVEDQRPGIVEDLTLRHTVLRIYDNLRIVIPNSEMNSKIITNTSYRMKDRRGLHLQFAVSYDTDIRKAMDIIRDCVVASPYTLGVDANGIHEDSGPVYFLKYADSSLLLDTTIWVTPETKNEEAITDVNIRVFNAFRKYGIEIPYPYFNVVQLEGNKTPAVPAAERAIGSVKRHHRSDTVHMEPGENRLQEAVATARSFAERQHMDKHAATQIELLMEESVDFVQRVAKQTKRDFWVEGTSKSYRIHIRFAAKVGSEEYKKLLEVSSTGRNEAANSFTVRIWEAVLVGLKNPVTKDKNSKARYEWQLSDASVSAEEIGKSILAAVASDIRVSVTSERVEVIVTKEEN